MNNQLKIAFGWCFIALMTLIASPGYATLQIKMRLADGSGKYIGTVRADDTIYGVLLTPKLHDLKPGVHAFHVHEVPLCDDHAKAAGGHLDLTDIGEHRGPYAGNSHSGDLPMLIVNSKGKATTPILAPRLKLSQIGGRALVIQAGEDNFSDTPVEDGGGGLRIACGDIPYH